MLAADKSFRKFIKAEAKVGLKTNVQLARSYLSLILMQNLSIY